MQINRPVSTLIKNSSQLHNLDVLFKKAAHQTVVGIRDPNETASGKAFFHIGFSLQDNQQRPVIEDVQNILQL